MLRKKTRDRMGRVVIFFISLSLLIGCIGILLAGGCRGQALAFVIWPDSGVSASTA